MATARPVEQLFFYLENPNKSANHLELFDFASQFQPTENGELLDSFDVYETSAESLIKQKRKEKKEYQSENISSISQRTEKASNIEIATSSKSYQNRVEHVRMGIFTHEILSKIKTKKDVLKVLNSYVLEGTITNDEKTSILERIENIINDKNYSSYFEENLIIINERDMLSVEDGMSKTYRPDRLIKTKDGFIIVDFKTGSEKEKDQKQVALYQEKLEQFGEKVLKTDVIYI